MNIHIDDNKSIAAVQKEFADAFPYLRLEFFAKPHMFGAGSARRDMLDHKTKLKECRLKAEGNMIIRPEMTVSDLEKHFKEKYRLFVQVFRRSGKLWLETTATDKWTLKYQNEQGQELSNTTFNDREEVDYHEQE